MNRTTILTITSLLTLLLTTLHVSDDFARGIDRAGVGFFPFLVLLGVWLYATLVLLRRRSGYIIVGMMCFLACGIPYIHMMGRSGITAGIKSIAGSFFFAWTLTAVGITGVFSTMLAARELWAMRKG